MWEKRKIQNMFVKVGGKWYVRKHLTEVDSTLSACLDKKVSPPCKGGREPTK